MQCNDADREIRTECFAHQLKKAQGQGDRDRAATTYGYLRLNPHLTHINNVLFSYCSTLNFSILKPRGYSDEILQ